MNQNRATVLGFLAASIVPAAYPAIAFPLSGLQNFSSILGSFFIFYFFSCMAIGLLGVPMFFILNRYQLVKWWSATGIGLVAGALALIGITSIGSSNLEELLEFSVLGGIAGFAFWIFWRLGRT